MNLKSDLALEYLDRPCTSQPVFFAEILNNAFVLTKQDVIFDLITIKYLSKRHNHIVGVSSTLPLGTKF